MKITRMERSRHVRDRVLVYPEEGAPLRLTEREVLDFDLYAGRELTSAEVSALEQAGKDSHLRAAAAKMASGQMLSRREVCRRLEKKGADAAAAEETADWLTELGAVDDAAYAAAIVRHYGRALYGGRRAQQELQRRGIPRELWEAALLELPDSGEAVRAYLRGKCRGAADEKTRKRLGDALLRRGFSWNDIRPALNELGGDIAE